ncbi:MAG: TonB family protein [Bacteroidales bacterium]|nr:TonB family protein [Bacteroidales bacterium]
MNKKILLLSLIFLIVSGVASAQDNNNSDNVNIIRLNQIHKLLDYRFVGGFYGFEKLFFQTVSYPEQAQQNCILGIMIASFEVSCNGELSNVSIKNSLGNGLDKEVSKFLNATRGHWNPCQDQRYTRFTIPIQFTLKGTETDSTIAAIVYTGNDPGYVCYSDSYYLKKAKEALEKGKGKRAQPFLETLIKRNPYEDSYYNLLEQAMNAPDNKSKKDKHKK